MTFYSQMVDDKVWVLNQYLNNLDRWDVNGILDQYLKNLVDADQGDWADYLGQVEFSCNVIMHLATKELSFVVVYEVRFNLLT